MCQSVCVYVCSSLSCVQLFVTPRDCSPPGSSVHGILQARILEWVAIPFSRDLPNPGVKPGLLHYRRILDHLNHLGSHGLVFTRAFPFLSSGFPGGAGGKAPAHQCRRCESHGFYPWIREIPWRRAWQSAPVFLPGESHGQKSLAGYSPWGGTESDMTEATWHTLHCHLKRPGKNEPSVAMSTSNIQILVSNTILH